MIKKIFFVLFFICLAGCTRITDDLQTQLNTKLASVQELSASKPSFDHGYYSYYLEPSVGRVSATATGGVLTYDGTQFLMSLNIPKIINENYFSDVSEITVGLTAADILASSSGNYTDYDGNTFSFRADIYDVSGKTLLIFSTDNMSFYAMCSQNKVAALAAEILKIARSVKVDEEKVCTAFTDIDAISYNRKTLELFSNVAPESGVIDELFIDHSSTGSTGLNSITGDISQDGNVTVEDDTAVTEEEWTEESTEEVTEENTEENEEETVEETASPEPTASPSAEPSASPDTSPSPTPSASASAEADEEDESSEDDKKD